jgi:hypothetical protein
MLMTKKESRSFWQLLPREREAILTWAEKHEAVLWAFNLELARVPPHSRSKITDDFCAKIAIPRDQLGWIQQANLQLLFGTVHRRVLHRVK